LLVGQHPVSVHDENDWSESQKLNAVLSQGVVHGRWQLVVVGELDLLSDVNEKKSDEANWEKDWKTNSIKHCHKHNVENSWVLTMNNVVWATVEIDVALH